MKIDFKNEKYEKIFKVFVRILPTLGLIVFVVIFSVLVSLSLFPGSDKVAEQAGNDKVKYLSIRFNTKLLDELNSPIKPGTPAGGRNPFGN